MPGHEMAILHRPSQSKTTHEIAETLVLRGQPLRNCVNTILDKLGIENRLSGHFDLVSILSKPSNQSGS